VVAAPADVVGAAVAAEVGLVPVAGVALRAADRVVARVARAGHVEAAVDGVKAKAVTAKADAEMAEASSSRT
jgi:hypothetical protein